MTSASLSRSDQLIVSEGVNASRPSRETGSAVKISVAHQCGYCSTVRSHVAKAEGLTEDLVTQLLDYESSTQFSAREKAALRYADAFKKGEHAIDSDEIFAQLHEHFTDEEIIELGLFCAETDGVGKFVRSLNVMSWEEACSLNPNLRDVPARLGETADIKAA